MTRSSARVWAYMPFSPALPNGVRTPSTKTTSWSARGTGGLPVGGVGWDPVARALRVHRTKRTLSALGRVGVRGVTPGTGDWIWIRLPQVSSNTAVVTGPIDVGRLGERPRRARCSRACSASTSSTVKAVNGMPSATSASLNGRAAGCWSGSSTSSTPSGASGLTTVSQANSPIGTSCFFSKPSTPV